MRFKRGSEVEVFSEKDSPCGSWHAGEIVSGNGRYYDIKFECGMDVVRSSIVERVSRKAIRPLPPPVYCLRDWVAGDLVEVFEEMSWKAAMVLEVVGGNHYVVRLLGSSQKAVVCKSEARARQVWKGNQWVMVGNGLGSCEGEESDCSGYRKTSFKVAGAGLKRKLYEDDNFQSNSDLPESHMVSSRTPKRGSPTGLSILETYTETRRKRRAIKKVGGHQRIAAGNISQIREKVDAVTSPQYMLGEKHMHASFNNQIYRVDTEMAQPNEDVECFSGRSLDVSDAESSTSSVGSCSINMNSPYRLSHCSRVNPSYDSDSNSSDAESFCCRDPEKQLPLPSEEDVTGEIHKLELHAYRCTIGALFCSGPLSWEHEELMTNLRLMLHISNDEHLLELRSLVSGDKNLITS